MFHKGRGLLDARLGQEVAAQAQREQAQLGHYLGARSGHTLG